jgi:hypothetical protein
MELTIDFLNEVVFRIQDKNNARIGAKAMCEAAFKYGMYRI